MESEEDAARDSDNEEAIATGLTREERKKKRKERLEEVRKSIEDARQARIDAAKKARQKALKEAEEKAFEKAELEASEEEAWKKERLERAAAFEKRDRQRWYRKFWDTEKQIQKDLLLKFAENEDVTKLSNPSIFKKWKTKLFLNPMKRSLVKQMEEILQFYLEKKLPQSDESITDICSHSLAKFVQTVEWAFVLFPS